MNKKYSAPEFKVISFSENADIIQTSGEVAPLSTLSGVEETLANYGTKDFNIFSN